MSDELLWRMGEKISPEERAAVDEGLDAYNLREGRLDEAREFAAAVCDREGTPIGGLLGDSWGERMRLREIWVARARRGQGLGRRLMQILEDEARSRRCTVIELETLSFQAPVFYEQLGYREVHRTTGFPRGIVKHYYEKQIVA